MLLWPLAGGCLPGGVLRPAGVLGGGSAVTLVASEKRTMASPHERTTASTASSSGRLGVKAQRAEQVGARFCRLEVHERLPSAALSQQRTLQPGAPRGGPSHGSARRQPAPCSCGGGDVGRLDRGRATGRPGTASSTTCRRGSPGPRWTGAAHLGGRQSRRFLNHHKRITHLMNLRERPILETAPHTAKAIPARS